MGKISLLFNEMDNYLLHMSGHSPAFQIEDRINFALIHARLYSDESDDELDNKSAATNTLYRYCCDVGSRYSLSAIFISVSANSYVVCC